MLKDNSQKKIDAAQKAYDQAKARLEAEKKKQSEKRRHFENHHKFMMGGAVSDPEKAYQPIFAIYDNTLAHLYYRFLYIYEDADYTTDWKGCSVPTSLNAIRRTNYQFMGSWPLNVIKNEYPSWKQRIESQKASEGYTTYTLSDNTKGSTSSSEYSFNKKGFIRALSRGSGLLFFFPLDGKRSMPAMA